ncbi:MAG: hypothetical protein JWQ04_1794, partial [Pedosphaera sp.]|nr:hypothetical protein [Pedosphaera sp.]
MADTIAASGRRGWPRIVGWILLALALLLIILYFVVSSTAFFKGVILPRVSKSLNARVTVADASIHPFSRVMLRHLKVQTTGPDPLFAAEEVRVAYSLGDILRGNYHVREMTAVSPVIEIVTNPDGTSNLDPITKKKGQANAPSRAKPAQPSKTAAPEKIDLAQLTLTNATVRLI